MGKSGDSHVALALVREDLPIVNLREAERPRYGRGLADAAAWSDAQDLGLIIEAESRCN